MKERIIISVVVIIISALAYVWFSQTGTSTAPLITMETTTGKKLSFVDYNDKPVLVVFWATTCTTCLKEMPHLFKLYKELNPKGLEIISITMSYDPPSQVVEMIKKRNIPYPVVMDLNKELMRGFGMKFAITPTSYLIAPGGRIVMQKAGLLDIKQLREQIIGYLEPTAQQDPY